MPLRSATLLLTTGLGLSLALGRTGADSPGSWFRQRAQAGSGGTLLRVLHFGDSHLAGAAGGVYYRRWFQGRFGDGGPGLGLPWVTPMPGVAAAATQGWRRSTRPGTGEQAAGLACGYLETIRPLETATLAGCFSRYRLYLALDPAGGKVAVRVDDGPAEEVDLVGEAGQATVLARNLPGRQASRKLSIQCTRPGRVRILGVALEGDAGAVYSPLAFNGARADWLRSVPDGWFRTMVQGEAPDLLILAFGTNEASAPEFDPQAYRSGLEALLGRFRAAAPGAVMVLEGPPDGQLTRGPAGALDQVIAIQRSAATVAGALFLDRRQAMGGPGAMAAWERSGLASRDLIHLTGAGYQRLSGTMFSSLEAATGQGGLIAPLAPAGPEPGGGGRTLYTFRRKDGGLFITDDPAKAEEQPGVWTRVAP